MSASDFRQIAAGAEPGKAERLFRAAVSAFCSLTRPSRREIAQLEDLTLPLFDNVSVESRRYVAAALSECEYAPAALVRRLCQERVDIAAPLLIRSRALSDVDLIALIGRHGLPHARAIARRKDLNQTIADLIRVLERPTLVRSQQPEATANAVPENAEMVAIDANRQEAADAAAETVRRRLRSMMRAESGTTIGPFVDTQTYVKLRETALTGNAAFFQTALADALEVDFSTARTLTASHNYTPLLAALRALDLSEDKAFLITAAIYPTEFPHPQAIRIFLDRYRLLHRDAALDRLRGWKADTVSKVVRKPGRVAANADLRKPNSADAAASSRARRV
ncbi:DUF2336 domain-containing protein [Mesorhizobium sp. M0622]|uniref:DUF2336 domain-containing protein n=1 Tax=unclassified Mesorhizobium TaxID=325217 RepID=UPI00333877D4